MLKAYGFDHPYRSVTYVLNLTSYPCSEPAPPVRIFRGLESAYSGVAATRLYAVSTAPGQRICLFSSEPALSAL